MMFKRAMSLMLCASACMGFSYGAAVPHTFSNGQVADANQVNENFSVLSDATEEIKFHMITGSETLGLPSRVMVLSEDDIELTLPEASTAAGKLYRVQKLKDKGSVNLVVASGNVAEPFESIELNVAGRTEVFSDGTKWHLLNKVGSDGEYIHPLSKGFGILKDIDPFDSSSPDNMVVFNGKVYFSASSQNEGTELWVTDGTPEGTSLFMDINSGFASSSPSRFVIAGSTMYFVATTSVEGQELWKTDGTVEGTALVKDIRSGSVGASPLSLYASEGLVFFSANDGTNGYEPWVSDGSSTGTILLVDMFVGAGSSSPNSFKAIGSQVVFAASDSSFGTELFVTDGTTAGTQLLKDIYTGAGSSNPEELYLYEGEVYFAAYGNDGQTELWKTDGTAIGTQLLIDIEASWSAYPSDFKEVDGMLYFSAHTDTFGREPWVTDGTVEGTQMLVDIFPGRGSTNPEDFVKVGERLLIVSGSEGQSLWSYAPDDLVHLGNFNMNRYTSINDTYEHTYLFPISGGFVFVDEGGSRLMWTNGTAEATVELQSGPFYFSKPTVLEDKLLFKAENYIYGNWGEELYILGPDAAPAEPPFGQVGGGEEA